VFSTLITLLVVPAGYLVLEDLGRLLDRARHFVSGRAAPVPAGS